MTCKPVFSILGLSKRSTGCLALAALLACAAQPVLADSVELDPTFATAGRANYSFGDYFKTLVHVPRPGGGSIAVVHYRATGNPVCVDGRDCIALYPFTAAGAALAPVTVPSNLNFSKVRGAAIDSQGRVVVVGSIQISGGDYDFRIARILANGSADLSFSSDGLNNVAFDLGSNNRDEANAVAIDDQDRIVVVGQVDRASTGDSDFGVARLLTNGTLDSSFDSDGKLQVAFDLGATLRLDAPYAVIVRNGKISIGGIAIDGDLGVSRIGLARLLENGGYDASFCATSCNYMSTYAAINNGRRVIFYGTDTPARSDSLEAMAVNSAGEFVTAGTTPGSGETFGYVQKFDVNGNWLAETTTQGGIDASRVYIGGVHWSDVNSASSNVVLTGASGPNEEFFFAQRLTSDLNPSANWGFIGPSNSVYLWTAGNGFGDIGDNRPASSSLGPAGQLLVDGIYKPAALADPYSATVARLRTVNGPTTDAIFKSGFEN